MAVAESGKPRTVASRVEGDVDMRMARHTLELALEQIEGALDPAIGCDPTRSDLLKMLGLVASDLRLVQRTMAQCERRGK